ncbi:MAG: hypothetical protein ACXAD7_20780 [Candidatus Kariarchaeaceae archaeon]|jgi:hypothetical protein
MNGNLSAIIYGINKLIDDDRLPVKSCDSLKKINKSFVESEKLNSDLTALFEALYEFTSDPDWLYECKVALWELITKIEKEFQ